MPNPDSHKSVTPPGRMSLDRLQRIKQWHVRHRRSNPLEYHLLDLVLTAWMMGWVAWLPALVLGQRWVTPLCVLGVGMPRLYARLRVHAHRRGRLRCDWLDLLE